MPKPSLCNGFSILFQDKLRLLHDDLEMERELRQRVSLFYYYNRLQYPNYHIFIWDSTAITFGRYFFIWCELF